MLLCSVLALSIFGALAPMPILVAQQTESSGTTTNRSNSNSELSEEIGVAFQQEDQLIHSELKAIVDDRSVIVTGVVPRNSDRKLAIQIARKHAGKRVVVDKITVKK
jgi:osmotically-inducible protein OsmY